MAMSVAIVVLTRLLDLGPSLTLLVLVHRARLFRIVVVFEERHHGARDPLHKKDQAETSALVPAWSRACAPAHARSIYSVRTRYARAFLSSFVDVVAASDSLLVDDDLVSCATRIWFWTCLTPGTCSATSSAIRFGCSSHRRRDHPRALRRPARECARRSACWRRGATRSECGRASNIRPPRCAACAMARSGDQFAVEVASNARITVTLICPGNVISSAI